MRCPTLVFKSKLAIFILGVGAAPVLISVGVGAEVSEVLAGVVIVELAVETGAVVVGIAELANAVVWLGFWIEAVELAVEVRTL
jgi:hypothetical protein